METGDVIDSSTLKSWQWLLVVFTPIAPLILALVTAYIYVGSAGQNRIIGLEEIAQHPAEILLLPGASIQKNKDGELAGAIMERCSTAATILHQQPTLHVFVSGDGRSQYYDEVASLQKCLEKAGIDAARMIFDRDGIRTQARLQHAKEHAPQAQFIIVTQRYHLQRALYLASEMNIKAVGVATSNGTGFSNIFEIFRETGARLKAVFEAIIGLG